MRCTWAAAAVLLAACGPSDREHDCAEVRAILAPPPAKARRYWDYKDAPVTSAPRAPATPRERLQQLEYRDPAVRDAVHDFIEGPGDGGWTLYTPYTTNASPTAGDKLRELCGVPQHQIVIEAR